AFPRTPDDVIVPWLVELLKRLQAAGHEVEVFTSSYRGAPDQVFAGIPVHRFRYFPRRWENLTHEEAAPDRMKHSLLYRLMPACFVLAGMRSEEHTSELQSRFDLVCRLLLEKKKPHNPLYIGITFTEIHTLSFLLFCLSSVYTSL